MRSPLTRLNTPAGTPAAVVRLGLGAAVVLWVFPWFVVVGLIPVVMVFFLVGRRFESKRRSAFQHLVDQHDLDVQYRPTDEDTPTLVVDHLIGSDRRVEHRVTRRGSVPPQAMVEYRSFWAAGDHVSWTLGLAPASGLAADLADIRLVRGTANPSGIGGFRAAEIAVPTALIGRYRALSTKPLAPGVLNEEVIAWLLAVDDGRLGPTIIDLGRGWCCLNYFEWMSPSLVPQMIGHAEHLAALLSR